jgi:hypothetical protein
MARVYADVLYAEAFGLDVIHRMVELAPSGWQREFAVLQARDEARHADFFGRALEKLGGSEGDSHELSCLREELAQIDAYEELVLHGQVIETAARVVFVGNGMRTLELMDKGVRLPGSESVRALVLAVVNLVGKDESRHIAFGQHCLRLHLSGCDAPRRHALEQRAAVSARLMYNAFAARSESFKRMGWQPADVLDRTWKALQAQLGALELDIGSAPDAANARFA